MIKCLAVLVALAAAVPAIAQTAPAQSWPVMSDHTLDMPAQGAHSRSRPWLKSAAPPVRKSGKGRRAG